VASQLTDGLVGTFRLVSLEARSTDGTTRYPMGEAPAGRFFFDRLGNFSVQLMSADHGSEDATTSGATYAALFGTYEVDEEQQSFTATVDGCLHPELNGTQFVRYVSFEDTGAVFRTPPQSADGVETTTFITWRRV
jgi:hypothetical protein